MEASGVSVQPLKPGDVIPETEAAFQGRLDKAITGINEQLRAGRLKGLAKIEVTLSGEAEIAVTEDPSLAMVLIARYKEAEWEVHRRSFYQWDFIDARGQQPYERTYMGQNRYR